MNLRLPQRHSCREAGITATGAIGTSGGGPRSCERLRIVIIGDVHGMWHPWRDLASLKLLKPDIILFVGDFGEEQVQLVRQVAAVKERMAAVGAHAEVAVILGNHDAWFHMFRKESAQLVDTVDKLTQQLEALGRLHVGYGRVDLPQWRLSIVGARPFSYGPSSWAKSFYRARCGVRTINASTSKITENILAAPESHSIVVLAHNGPAGLGSHPWDICGKDFPSKGLPPGGDFGDEDLSRAITASLEGGRHIPLVVFGHMHRDLFPFNYRSRTTRQGEAVSQRRMAAVLLHPASQPLPSSASLLAAATQPAARPAVPAQSAISVSAAGSMLLAAPSTTHASSNAVSLATTYTTTHTVFLNAAVVPRIVALDEEHFTRTSGPGLAVYPALGSEPLDATPELLLPYLIGLEGRGSSGPGGIIGGVCRRMEGLGLGDARDERGGGESQVAAQAGCVGDDTSAAEMSQRVVDALAVAGMGGRDGELCGDGEAEGVGKAGEAVVWEDEVRWEGEDGVAVDAGAAPSLHHFVLAHLAVQGASVQGQVGEGPVGQEFVPPGLDGSVATAAGDGDGEGQCVDGGPGRWVCVGAEDVWIKVDERTDGGGRRGAMACLHRKDKR
ncbi:unnamed protein product [Closterium sp. Yama58-4]|nr:unnamed protein product [Closterium sp. Yama58-4]